MTKHRAKKLSGMQFPAQLADALEMARKEEKAAQSPTAVAESTLRERALLVRFSIGRWYGSGADEEVVSEIRVAKNATGEIGSFTKRLMKREHLLEINRVTAKARQYHKLLTLPWGDGDTRILNVASFREYKEHMTKYEGEFFAAVDDFMKKYPELVQAEKKNLGDLWRESDYPHPDRMRASFRFGLSVDILSDAKDMRINLSAEQAEEIRREIEQRMHEALAGTVSDVYARIAEQLDAIKERLDDPDTRLQTKLFEKLEQVITLLPRLNLANDPKLNKLGADIRRELIGTAVSSLRDSPSTRQQTSAKAAKMLAAIDALKGKP